MPARPNSATPFFNPQPEISLVPIMPGQVCVVVDDALSDPQALVDWVATQAFSPPRDYPYPGLVLEAPAEMTARVGDSFALRARSHLGARRTQSVAVRFSMVTTPPAELAPIQWQCHRDRLAVDPARVIFAAMVLYLFREPALGGTSFYRPRLSEAQLERMNADSEALNAAEFGARYGLQAGYMLGSNPNFDLVSSVPAAWNRMIFYDGGLFHSADISQRSLDSADPRVGRLTLNGFFNCRRNLG